MSDDELDIHLDAILRAAGSGLQHYTPPGNVDNMRKALRFAMDAHLRTAQPVAQEVAEDACETCGGTGTVDCTLGGEHFSDPRATCPDCDGRGHYAAPVVPLVAQEAVALPARAKRVIDAARAAVDDEAGKDRYLDDLICIPSHRAAALSLALDEYDAAPVAPPVAQEAVAFAKDGSLFWYGEHKRGASCDLYAAPVASQVRAEPVDLGFDEWLEGYEANMLRSDRLGLMDNERRVAEAAWLAGRASRPDPAQVRAEPVRNVYEGCSGSNPESSGEMATPELIAQGDASHHSLHPAPSSDPTQVRAEAPTQAAVDVLAERRRQVEVEGWSPEHDDEHDGPQMALAAMGYLQVTACELGKPAHQFTGTPLFWPWDESWFKPAGPRRNLVKAGALILAEIERLDRALKEQS